MVDIAQELQNSELWHLYALMYTIKLILLMNLLENTL